MAKERYSAGEVIEKVIQSRGLLSVTAQLLGCTRQTVENYVKRHPSIAQAVKEERAKVVDVAEAKLFEKLQSGESWAIQFVLKTLGKNRGYSERTDLMALMMSMDVGNLTDEQLQRIADGENPVAVIAATGAGGD